MERQEIMIEYGRKLARATPKERRSIKDARRLAIGSAKARIKAEVAARRRRRKERMATPRKSLQLH
jgi:hypothetical protein